MSSSTVQPLLALLSSHVGGNPTQYVFERAFAHHNLDWRYLTFEIGPEKLEDAVRGLRALGFRGGHCGDAYKQAILPLLDRLTDTAAMIGAVNLIYREDDALVGENTEGKALVRTIGQTTDLAGKNVLLLGAGRVARAAAVELAAAGVAGITIVNRTEPRAGQILALLAEKFTISLAANPWTPNYAIPPETDIVVHATSMKRAESQSLLAWDTLRPKIVAADAAAFGSPTRLLDEAAQRGCQTVDGLSVYIEQVAMGFERWTGTDPDRQVLREAVEEFLEL